MRFRVTGEEIRKRFRLYCDIFMICAELQGDEDDEINGYEISAEKLFELTGKPEDFEITFDFTDDERFGKCIFTAIEFDGETPFIYFDSLEGGWSSAQSVLHIPSEEVQKVVDVLKEIKFNS